MITSLSEVGVTLWLQRKVYGCNVLCHLHLFSTAEMHAGGFQLFELTRYKCSHGLCSKIQTLHFIFNIIRTGSRGLIITSLLRERVVLAGP